MKKRNSILLKNLPFDQFSRQKAVSECVDILRGGTSKLRILDVGGYKGATQQFQPDDKVTVLDVFDVEEEGYIKGDATDMKFADGEYDYVVSFDVFEHIPEDKRESFVSECYRVARYGVFIAAPIGTKKNQESEQLLNSLYKKMHAEDHRWLSEHIEYGLPGVGQADALLKKHTKYTIEIGNNYTPIWLLMQSHIFVASKYSEFGEYTPGLFVDYNNMKDLDYSANLEMNYRSIVMGFKDLKNYKKISEFYKDKNADNSRTNFSSIMSVISNISTSLVGGLGKMEKNIKEKNDHIRNIENIATQDRAKIDDLERDNKVLNKEKTAIMESREYQLSVSMLRAARPFLKFIKRG